jgi:formyltetrahydrofolate deformylase
VTEQLDEGPVILQDVFHIAVGSDTLDDVKRKGLDLEAKVLSKAVKLFLDEELVVVEGKGDLQAGDLAVLRSRGGGGGGEEWWGGWVMEWSGKS